jgi:hypothetical protein
MHPIVIGIASPGVTTLAVQAVAAIYTLSRLGRDAKGEKGLEKRILSFLFLLHFSLFKG